MFHVKRRSLLHGIIGRTRAAAEPRDRKPLGSLGEGTELSTEVEFSTEQQASLVHDPEDMGGSVHCEPEVEESESLRSDANIAGPMTDPVPGPRTESMGRMFHVKHRPLWTTLPSVVLPNWRWKP